MRLEHLLSGEDVDEWLSFKFRQAAFAARPLLFSVVCTAYGGLPFCGGRSGGLAQLARAPALQAGGQRFESVILHVVKNGRIKEWKN